MILRKRIFLMVLLVVGTIGTLWAGGGSQSRSSTTTGGAATFTGTRRSRDGYALPILESPKEFTFMTVLNNTRPLAAEYNNVVGWIEQQTNIRLRGEWTTPEAANVRFSSRDFPDFIMGSGGISDTVMLAAALDGDLVPLDDLVAQYAPTWNRFFTENRPARNMMSINNILYTIPNLDGAPSTANLRDMWLINEKWLNELGLRVPTDINELRTVLRAFHDNRGRGSIPRDAVPFYYTFGVEINATIMEVFANFGINIPHNSDFCAVENGRIVYQPINPDIRAPLRYLQELFREGYTPPEILADSNAVFNTKAAARPSILGFYSCFMIANPDDYIAIPPLETFSGKRPFNRRQQYGLFGPGMSITSNCDDPVALVKLAELIAGDTQFGMNVSWGLENIFWRFNPSGRIERLIAYGGTNFNENVMSHGWYNQFVMFWDQNFFETKFEIAHEPRTREWYYENIYRNFPAPANGNPFWSSLGPDRDFQRNTLRTDLDNEIWATWARWITTNANIDAEWDTYVARLRSLGYERLVALRQEAHDMMTR